MMHYNETIVLSVNFSISVLLQLMDTSLQLISSASRQPNPQEDSWFSGEMNIQVQYRWMEPYKYNYMLFWRHK